MGANPTRRHLSNHSRASALLPGIAPLWERPWARACAEGVRHDWDVTIRASMAGVQLVDVASDRNDEFREVVEMVVEDLPHIA